MASPRESVLAKYDRSQKHVNDLMGAVDAFRYANRDHVDIQTNEQTGDVTYYLRTVPIVPNEIALILGDAVHNLRSTLDYLICALVLTAGGPDCEHTGFPIFESAKFYHDTSAVKVKGVGKFCKEKLDLVQPYRGGSGHILWQLHRLDIMDKHRLLPAITFAPIGRTMTPSEREKFNAAFSRIAGPTLKGAISVPHHWVSAGPAPPVPLQAGQELLTLSAEDAKQNMGFSFDVAIHEPGTIEATPISLFIALVSSEISQTISDMAPWL